MSESYINLCISLAQAAAKSGEVPVGAVIVNPANGEIVAKAHNLTESMSDPTAHAEMLCIKEAAQKISRPRLPEFDMYVSLEPCAMCAAAISFARIRKLVFGAYDPKGGGVEYGARIFSQSTCHHKPEVIGGVNESECGAVLREFFAIARKDK